MTARQDTIVSLGLFAIVWTIDRLVKALVLAVAPDGSSSDAGFSVSVHRTSGLVFDTLTGSTPVLLLVIGIVSLLCGVFIHALRRADRYTALALALVLAGALGNLIDRLAYGYVVDFLVLPGSAVVNIADLAILTGAVLVLVGGFRRPAHAAHPQAR
ncbi:MAG: signal peptidase II [Candidatus Kerfeldbacteria bacterium]|nr:signal peptidase II [Candidatus Kerfeldbacteria bacterium]